MSLFILLSYYVILYIASANSCACNLYRENERKQEAYDCMDKIIIPSAIHLTILLDLY